LVHDKTKLLFHFLTDFQIFQSIITLYNYNEAPAPQVGEGTTKL